MISFGFDIYCYQIIFIANDLFFNDYFVFKSEWLPIVIFLLLYQFYAE